jgi:transcriptional regulator with XRE-family HTH domain
MAERTKKKKNSILMDFAKKVRSRRYQLELSQEQLAERADFHVNYIGGIERAERNPSLTSLVTLANALEVDLSDLLSEFSSKKS